MGEGERPSGYVEALANNLSRGQSENRSGTAGAVGEVEGSEEEGDVIRGNTPAPSEVGFLFVQKTLWIPYCPQCETLDSTQYPRIRFVVVASAQSWFPVRGYSTYVQEGLRCRDQRASDISVDLFSGVSILDVRDGCKHLRIEPSAAYPQAVSFSLKGG
jgi:hypothetical protein